MDGLDLHQAHGIIVYGSLFSLHADVATHCNRTVERLSWGMVWTGGDAPMEVRGKNMARMVKQKKLDRQTDNPKCPKCGRVDIVALTSQTSRSNTEGAMIPDAPELTWRCVACKHEWPR